MGVWHAGCLGYCATIHRLGGQRYSTLTLYFYSTICSIEQGLGQQGTGWDRGDGAPTSVTDGQMPSKARVTNH